jgi:hypothetical protein
MEFELLLWKSAFILYVSMHLFAKLRRFYATWLKQRRAKKRARRGWF